MRTEDFKEPQFSEDYPQVQELLDKINKRSNKTNGEPNSGIEKFSQIIRTISDAHEQSAHLTN